MQFQITAAIILGGAISLGAQQPSARPAPPHSSFDFSIKGIMRGHEMVGRAPTDVRWSADSRWIYFSWNPPGTASREPLQDYRVRAQAGAVPESLTVAQMDSAGPLAAVGDLSPNNSMRAVEWNGDIFVVTLRTGVLRRLTSTVARETDPHFDREAKHVFFVRENNAFSFDLATGEEKQLTDIRLGPKPKEDEKATPQRAFLEAQQRELLGAVRDEIHLDSLDKREKAQLDSLAPRTLWLRKDERAAARDDDSRRRQAARHRDPALRHEEWLHGREEIAREGRRRAGRWAHRVHPGHAWRAGLAHTLPWRYRERARACAGEWLER
jgi:hypothetical protein